MQWWRVKVKFAKHWDSCFSQYIKSKYIYIFRLIPDLPFSHSLSLFDLSQISMDKNRRPDYIDLPLEPDYGEEVVKDKLPPLSALGGIKIKGRAKDEESERTSKSNKLKQHLSM